MVLSRQFIPLILQLILLRSSLVLADGQHDPEQAGNLPYVTLFSHEQFTNTAGKQWQVMLSDDCTCQNYPITALGLVSAILTNGNCVILYMDKGCYGYAIRMEDYSFGYRNLALVGINDASKSLMKCGCNGEPRRLPTSSTTTSTISTTSTTESFQDSNSTAPTNELLDLLREVRDQQESTTLERETQNKTLIITFGAITISVVIILAVVAALGFWKRKNVCESRKNEFDKTVVFKPVEARGAVHLIGC